MAKHTSLPGDLDIPLFSKPERSVDKVFIHCSASSLPEHANINEIERWHILRGFDEIGYHYFIDFDGNISFGRSLEKQPAAQEPYNTGSIAICLAGLRVSDFKLVQLDALIELCTDINHEYRGHITFHGHKEVSSKPCPVFDYKHYLKLDEDGFLNANKTSVATKPLEVFDRGVEVVNLQRRLNQYYMDAGFGAVCRVDGVFGQETAQAVTRFQLEHDLVPTGTVDSLTMLQLPALRRR